MEGEAEFDVAFFERFKHLQITPERLVVVTALFRFDPRPLDRHAEHPVSQFAQQTEILLPEIPEIARFPGRLPEVLFLFPVPAGTVDVVSFDLMSGGCGSPVEPVREGDPLFHGKDSEHAQTPWLVFGKRDAGSITGTRPEV